MLHNNFIIYCLAINMCLPLLSSYHLRQGRREHKRCLEFVFDRATISENKAIDINYCNVLAHNVEKRKLWT